MNVMQTRPHGYYRSERCNFSDFADITSKTLSADDVPSAGSIEQNIPIYDASGLKDTLTTEDSRRQLMAEWADVLLNRAGILILKNAVTDLAAIDDATGIYEDVINREKQKSGGGGDHFAKAGANDRIWNSLQKLCEASPAIFARYLASPSIDAVCEAWLGPNYQMTAQVNVVHPGGGAQQAHRDYHLGFQSADVSASYPAHVHDLSPLMTLQGGIAHCDMPVESGPTKLLPFSQLYRPGYVAWRREDFRDHFEEHCVQIPLKKGDSLFFNPALFHAAGANTTSSVHRMANLLQISSAFGRAMENIDRKKMLLLLYPELQRISTSSSLGEAEIKAVIAASAEGYSFPTNLDRDPPIGGLAPETQNQLIHRALREDMTPTAFGKALEELENRKLA